MATSAPINNLKLPPGRELDRIISLQEAQALSSLSVDSWKRHHRDKLVALSPRRLGVRLRHALMIGKKGNAEDPEEAS